MPTIRAATTMDLDEILRIDQEVFGAYGADEDPEVIEARLQVFPEGCAVLEEWDERFQRETFLGYLTTEKWEAVREPSLNEDPRTAHKPWGDVLNITTLAIDPDYQNRGFGRQLLDQAITIAEREECTQIVLETARAKDFYERNNFELIGEREERGIKLWILKYAL